jgi:hypothetical protein
MACGPGGDDDASRWDPASRARVYDRTDRDFESGLLWRPEEGEESPQRALAPLWVEQVSSDGVPDGAQPIVRFSSGVTRLAGREHTTWTYAWYPRGGAATQGLRMTLGSDGFPLIYEVLRDSAGARLIFVDAALEERAARDHGAALPGRRFAVERSVEEAPRVVVGGLLEPGPIPMGPFVYLWETTADVNLVLCRCMPSRVDAILESRPYRLEAMPDGGAGPEWLDEGSGASLDAFLRLPTDLS